MAIQNLQTLVLRAAINAGKRVTVLGGKVAEAVVRPEGTTPSSPWHPMPGSYPTPDSRDERVSRDDRVSTAVVVRAGRSEGLAGSSFCLGFARGAFGRFLAELAQRLLPA